MSRSATINPETMSFFKEALGSAHLPVDVAEFNGIAVAHRPKGKKPLNRSHRARRNVSFPIPQNYSFVPEVAAVQGVLIKLGHLAQTGSSGVSNTDGKLGPATMAAINAFQRSKNMSVTSNLDQVTYDKIIAAGSAPVQEDEEDEKDESGNKVTKEDIMEGFEIGKGVLSLFGIGQTAEASTTGSSSSSAAPAAAGPSTTTLLLIGGAILLIGGGGLIYALTRK